MNTKERFKKVACGYNFSLGLSPSNKLYFWGNLKYSCDQKSTKDFEEPILIPDLESLDVVEVACEAKICYAMLEDGSLRQWGRFLLKKSQNPPKKQPPKQTGSRNKKE